MQITLKWSIVLLFTIAQLIPVTVFGEVIYQFIVFPINQQAEIDALEIDLGQPRLHPDSTQCLTNRNGNLPLTVEEITALEEITGLVLVNSDSIDVFLEENGWNEGGVQ